MRNSIHFRINSTMDYKLSILIPTLNSRSEKLKLLIDELNYQIQSKPVEILWFGDNKSMSVGEKRNILLSIAKGEYISFIDDDDNISDDYIDIVLQAIKSDKTVICFNGHQISDGIQDLDFRYNINYGRNFKKDISGKKWKVMIPDHLCVWKREKIAEKFPHKNLSEDHAWAKQMALHYTDKDQLILPYFLYTYNYNRDNSECRR